MFSPGIKRGNLSSRKDRNVGPASTLTHSPITPLAENRLKASDASVPGRPATGTPAPWAPRLSVLARFSPPKAAEESKETDSLKPVFIGEFPRVVHDEQTSFLRKRFHADGNLSGGMDKETCLSWMVCGSKLFIWSYLSSAASDNCVSLEIPPGVLDSGDMDGNTHQDRNWLVTFVKWDPTPRTTKEVRHHSKSIGVVMCNRKSRAVLYWPGIYGDAESTPLVTFAPTNESLVSSTPDGRKMLNRQQHPSSLGSSSTEWRSFNALIASAVPNMKHECVALASCSSGELWRFYCNPVGINSKRSLDVHNSSSQGSYNGRSVESKGYPRSLIWRFTWPPHKDSTRHFFLLTDDEIECHSIQLSPDLAVSKLWSHEIVSTDGDLGIKKGLAGQKRIWPLDMQVDDNGKVITVLLAAFCKDRVNSSSYTQYSLLTMQYKSGVNSSPDKHERILEKKAPPQEIIPKARVEDEGFLFSMRLKVGGKPLGSAVILSGDGTATISHYYNNSTWLFQFSLPYDTGKVLDASVLPSTDDGEDGAWVVLTEKAGIWAIPEKAVVLGGVQPPERSLSRKGSLNEGSSQGEKRTLTVAANVAPRRFSSDAQQDAADRQRAAMSGITPRADEEALVNHFFQEFLLSGKIDDCLEKLRSSGAFEREAEANVFVRTSKSIVDTLAKHWTTTRGAEILAMAVLSTQFVEKQQKHQKFLQFLAISKCHDELCLKQRHSLQIILEHGEKLSSMLQLRELQNIISQNRPSVASSTYTSTPNQVSGALWDLVQLVGERARRNTVLLMDRDNAEVFYSKVSDLEQAFYCLEKHLDCIISVEQPIGVQIQRACELSNACVTIIHSSMRYKTENHLWYPPPEGLMPWYCQMLVRSGIWSIASFMLQLMKETTGHYVSAKSICSHLESLAEVLLEAFSGAITAKVERGEEHKGLLNEYWSKRDALLNSLYDQVKSFAETAYPDINDRTEDQKQETLRGLSSSLLLIAKQHSGYQTMWNICCDINDSELLKILMHESMGPQSGFSYFVFEQLYEKRQFSKVLRLGEEFQEELSIFLKRHSDLLWLHEIYLHQFAEAAVTLHAYALSQDEDLILTGVEAANADQKVVEQTLVDRRRNLNLAKIAAFAGGDVKDATLQAKVRRIEADLQILSLQEEIMGFLQDEEVKQSAGKRLLSPDELIGLCLQSGDRGLAVQIFNVFACTSSSFRKSHKNLLEECWRNAADQDPWAQLYQASVDEGWSDEETVQRLRQTVLYLASNRCYGPQSEAIEDGFDQVLPPRLENMEDPESSSSVEGILMHHPDYSIAGKLMLMAIMLGTVQDDTQIEEGIHLE